MLHVCVEPATLVKIASARLLRRRRCCAEIMKYLKACKEPCAHIHILPVYHLSLPAHNSHHGSFGRGINEASIDCR